MPLTLPRAGWSPNCMFEYRIQQMQDVSNNNIARLWMKTGMVMQGGNAARALVNETEEEEMEFRDRFVDVIK